MLTVDDYGQIRRAFYQDGLSKRAIARTFHHSRRKIREALANPEPKPYTRSKPPPLPRLGDFTAIIDGILAADVHAPRKQRHTATQIFRRLTEEHGYAGSYSPVQRYVAKHRRQARETFIPLTHDPGQRLECDFGHIYVDFPDGRRQVPVLIASWSYSSCTFGMAMPTERTEAILAGMVQAFAFFGCVPREVWWDNPKTVAITIGRGRQRRLNERYAALASHYAFEPMACMPASGNEKPVAENRVYCLQRRWATPVPQFRDLAELNTYLRSRALKDRERHVGSNTESIGQRFEYDKAKALPVPTRAFDPCVRESTKADKYQTVRFDNVRYSVPRPYAFRNVTVKGYIDHVEVVSDDQVIARHDRSYEHSESVLDPLHYLATLGRRPAALDHAGVYRNWRLPAVFEQLREEFEQRDGSAAGARQYIRVLQLLAEHPLERLQEAVEHAQRRRVVNVDAIRHHVQRSARSQEHRAVDADGLVHDVSAVHVPRDDLNRFDQLLTSGEPTYV